MDSVDDEQKGEFNAAKLSTVCGMRLQPRTYVGAIAKCLFGEAPDSALRIALANPNNGRMTLPEERFVRSKTPKEMYSKHGPDGCWYTSESSDAV